MAFRWPEKQLGMNLTIDPQSGFDIEPVNDSETSCIIGEFLSPPSPWLWNIETVMDSTFDYLMPTSMSRASKASMSQTLPPSTWGMIFDRSLKVLESDTCSEISDFSFSHQPTYDRIHQFRKSNFERRGSDTDLEEYVLPWERNFKIEESFDKSLQAFLEWPNAENFDGVKLDSGDGFRDRRKSPGDKKQYKGLKSKTVKHHVKPKILIEDDSFQDVDSTDDDSSVFFPSSRKTIRNKFDPVDTSEKIETTFKTAKFLSPRQEMESDSDYRTYSDTSSERIGENNNDADVDDLKFLMSSVFEKAEIIKKALKEIDAAEDIALSSAIEKPSDVVIRQQSDKHSKRQSSDFKLNLDMSPRNRRREIFPVQNTYSMKVDKKSLPSDSCSKASLKEASFANSKLEIVASNHNKTFSNYDRSDHDRKVTNVASDTESDSESFVSFIQRLVKSLGKKEGELEGFKDLLKRAEESLSQSESAVEVGFSK